MLSIGKTGSSQSFDLPVLTDEAIGRLTNWYDNGRFEELNHPYGHAIAPRMPDRRVGSLFWPLVGASRFAHGVFAIDSYTLARLRAQLDGTNAVTLSYTDDPTDTAEVPRTHSMFLLASRPVSRTNETATEAPAQQTDEAGDPILDENGDPVYDEGSVPTLDGETEPATDDLWLITLVDQRWYWVHTTGTGQASTWEPTDWDDLFTVLFGNLNSVAFSSDTIDPAYGSAPGDRWTGENTQSVPTAYLLDDAAQCLGMRVVVADGVTLQRPSGVNRALVTDWQTTQFADDRIGAGGTIDNNERLAGIPELVYAAWQDGTTETVHQGVGLAGFSLDAWIDMPFAATGAQRTTALTQWAADWLAWQDVPFGGTINGFSSVPASGFCGQFERYHSGVDGYTRLNTTLAYSVVTNCLWCCPSTTCASSTDPGPPLPPPLPPSPVALPCADETTPKWCTTDYLGCTMKYGCYGGLTVTIDCGFGSVDVLRQIQVELFDGTGSYVDLGSVFTTAIFNPTDGRWYFNYPSRDGVINVGGALLYCANVSPPGLYFQGSATSSAEDSGDPAYVCGCTATFAGCTTTGQTITSAFVESPLAETLRLDGGCGALSLRLSPVTSPPPPPAPPCIVQNPVVFGLAGPHTFNAIATTNVRILAWGAGAPGGTPPLTNGGGGGAEAEDTVAVTIGDSLQLNVGSSGSDDSYVLDNAGNLLVYAGSGGSVSSGGVTFSTQAGGIAQVGSRLVNGGDGGGGFNRGRFTATAGNFSGGGVNSGTPGSAGAGAVSIAGSGGGAAASDYTTTFAGGSGGTGGAATGGNGGSGSNPGGGGGGAALPDGIPGSGANGKIIIFTCGTGDGTSCENHIETQPGHMHSTGTWFAFKALNGQTVSFVFSFTGLGISWDAFLYEGDSCDTLTLLDSASGSTPTGATLTGTKTGDGPVWVNVAEGTSLDYLDYSWSVS